MKFESKILGDKVTLELPREFSILKPVFRLQVEEEIELTLYLTADGVACAKRGQKTPQGYYNLERILKPVLRRGTVMACRTCLEARGLTPDDLMEGVLETRLGDLAQLTLEADKVLTF